MPSHLDLSTVVQALQYNMTYFYLELSASTNAIILCEQFVMNTQVLIQAFPVDVQRIMVKSRFGANEILTVEQTLNEIGFYIQYP